MTLGIKSSMLYINMDAATSAPISQDTQPSRWMTLARIFQIVVICLTVGLFIVSIPLNYEYRSLVCAAPTCPPGQLTSASVQALRNVGFSVDAFVKMTIALDILVAAAFTVSAVVIFVRKPNDPFTIFVTITLVTFGLATFSGGIDGVSMANPQLRWLTESLKMIGDSAMIAFLFIFPTGRFSPRWTFVILIGWFVFQFPRYYSPDSVLNLARANPPIYNLLFSATIVGGLATQINRYRHVSNAIERQQTKWVVYGLTIGVGGYIAARLSNLLLPDPIGSSLPIAIGLSLVSILFMLLVPFSITVAVLRYRLWDINPIINRTLVYGALSASTMALYILAVGFFASVFQNNQFNYIVAFIATGLIAILFEPLRRRLQRAVNRLMYGERDDSATVLGRLSQRLDSTLAPDSVLPTIVETVAQTLRLPYAAIKLYQQDVQPRTVAEFGPSPFECIHIPLTYQTEKIGELLLAPRDAGESFSTADLRLLGIIAQQAGVAAHTVHLTDELRQLNTDLQKSREHLVTAQEEERRRLRRDLHDGVGPTLASLSHRLDTAADLVTRDPQASVEFLQELKGQVKGAVAEIRRLVYALRPPVLDEFGLVSAVREHVAPYAGPNGLQVTFDVTEPMPPLPAAVEVAAYRIALEAFTNVVQHAQAHTCQIKIKPENDALVLEVSDDGTGLAPHTRSGVGLTSMRERVSELGGECLVQSIPSGGTRIHARLPIPKE